MRSSRTIFATAIAAVSVLALAACSSQGGAQAENSDATSQRYVVAMVTHESPGDSFWDKVRAGAEQAAQDLNVELRYSNDPDGGRQATLVQSAIDSQVDGVAVTLSQADQVGPAVQKAAQAGIPTVAFNSGIDVYTDYDVKMYFGSDENLAGQTAGQRIAADGGGKTLCVVHEQGSVALEARCAGVKSADPDTENLQVNGTDLPSVQQTIGAKLQQDPSITHVVTLSAPVAQATLQAKTSSGSQAKVITFDLNAEIAKAVQDGQIEFSIDQQPYVQGYMAVQTLWLNITNGNDLGGGKPVLTGPSFVDSSNIAQIAPFAEKNTR
ncbi:substrate-binding domain-containing protein [Pseudonocardia sp. HH130630-07]|uniref:substrate-binding domain-containing protein n=1 Tax=Pseudonocardia sp. HH130630-07 TaxID=1690815 RepID=UPI000814F77E|nr:substrate-binding domain-containing protein [Pseudonocardia sp. HH130630-07]ANY08917.1 sugar ABC transporter substrate-binding protein [Pseudonocardia sp. HH130630-07]